MSDTIAPNPESTVVSHSKSVGRRLAILVILLVVAIVFTGFAYLYVSTKPVAVRGTITRDGQKLTWPNGGTLLVIFVPENRTANTAVYAAKTDTETSSFSIEAIPPGRYKVAIQQFDARFFDAFGDAYGLSHTQLTRDVNPDTEVLDFDLPKDIKGPKSGFGGGGGGGGKGANPQPRKKDPPGPPEPAPFPRKAD